MIAAFIARLRRLLPLPIAVFLALFFSVVVLLFILIGWYMLERMDEVKHQVAESNRLAANVEMERALNQLHQSLEEAATRLLAWEEVYQQLHDPTYYQYWRNNRALQAGHLPHFISSLALFDKEGDNLDRDPAGQQLPARLPPGRGYIQMVRGHGQLFYFIPIPDRGDAQRLLGYAGLRVDLLETLLSQNKFNQVDTTTLTLTMREGERVPVETLRRVISFNPHGLVETRELERVMRESLIHFSLLALCMTLLGYLLVSRLLHAPLRCLTRHIDDLRNSNQVVRGDSAQAQNPLCLLELELLRDSLDEYQQKLYDMHNRLDQKNNELWEMAHQDPLTGIANRRAYDEEWRQLLNLVRGQRLSVAVLLIDCDHFKAINDTYGHATGDEVLRVIATTLRGLLRDGDRLYRLGGDEFAIHLINSGTNDAERIALRCLERLAAYDFATLGISEQVRFSIGIAVAEGTDTERLSNLHHNADVAMYLAKRPGHGKLVLYEDKLAEQAGELILSNRYINAVYSLIEDPSCIDLAYQPIYPLTADGHGIYEVLTRVRDKTGIIMPDTLLPVVIAEQLESEFDFAVFRRIEQSIIEGRMPVGLPISINIGATTLLERQLPVRLEPLRRHLQAEMITLEITETALISDLNRAAQQIEKLRAQGYRIALDDFGSGYSSLRYLANMPVDIIKFDISMIHDLLRDPRQSHITETTARMVRESGYLVVAEGVESEALLTRVKECGFTHVQGFLTGRPAHRIDPNRSIDHLPGSF